MIKYFLEKKPLLQTKKINLNDVWYIDKKDNNFVKLSTMENYEKIIIPTNDKNFSRQFLKQFFPKEILNKIELVRDLPH